MTDPIYFYSKAEAWRELSLAHAALGDDAACDAAHARAEKLAPESARLSEVAGALANEQFSAAESSLIGMLEIVLAEFEPPRFPIHAVFPPSGLAPANTRLFADLLAERLKHERL